MQIAQLIKTNFFISRMRIRLHNINQQYSLNMFLNENETNSVSNLFCKSDKKFSEEMKKWKNNFPSDYEIFKKIKEEKLHKLKEKFDLHERTILKDEKFLKKSTYVKDQYELLYHDMTKLIEEELKKIMDDCYISLMNELPDNLKEKFNNMSSQEIGKYDLNQGINISKNGLILLFCSGIGFAIADFSNITGTLGIAAALSGPPGLIIGGFAVIGVLTLSLRNYIGLWKRDECFDEVVKLFYETIKNNFDEIINRSNDLYKKLFTNLKDYLIELKETSREITKLHQIINNYVTTNIDSIKDTREELFKKALQDFEEKDEVKDIFEKNFFKENK